MRGNTQHILQHVSSIWSVRLLCAVVARSLLRCSVASRAAGERKADGATERAKAARDLNGQNGAQCANDEEGLLQAIVDDALACEGVLFTVARRSPLESMMLPPHIRCIAHGL